MVRRGCRIRPLPGLTMIGLCDVAAPHGERGSGPLGVIVTPGGPLRSAWPASSCRVCRRVARVANDERLRQEVEDDCEQEGRTVA
jgi:hypothetical protein